jgi:hypothetical protein
MRSKNLARLLERIDYLEQNPQEKRLRIDDVQAEFLPPLPPNVTNLVMNRCHFRLIDNFSSALAYLRMYSCTSSRLVLPQRLEHAWIHDCRGFKWLPDLPESLETLGLKGCEIKSLPKLNRKLEKDAVADFSFEAGLSAEAKAPFATFKKEEKLEGAY